FLRDGLNRIYVLRLGASLNGNGTFQVTSVETAGFAVQMDVGRDTSQPTAGQLDFLAYRAGDNSVNVIELVAGVPDYAATGASAIDLKAGNEKETFIREPSNQIQVLTINTTTASGITFKPIVTTPGFALQMGVGRNNPIGDDYLVYRAGDNSVNFMNYSPG